jgi:hypothetical protein
VVVVSVIAGEQLQLLLAGESQIATRAQRDRETAREVADELMHHQPDSPMREVRPLSSRSEMQGIGENGVTPERGGAACATIPQSWR